MKKKVKSSIVVITGPTSIGKTSAGINLVETFGGEIINADSMQIYKYMDIGTAKPDSYEQKRAKHHLIDIVEPDENFDAASYSNYAGNIIKNLNQKKIKAYVVGGTGLYIKALIKGLINYNVINEEIKDKLKKQLKEKGNIELYNKLKEIDFEASKKISPNDSFRIIRALEVYYVSGKKISDLQKAHNFKSEKYNVLKIALNIDRSILYDRINKRVDNMMKQGFIDEVNMLLKKGYSMDLKSMKSIGYSHICQYLSNKISLEDSINLLKRDTRRYAKRQLTWFKKDSDIIWIKPDDLDKIYYKIENFYNSRAENIIR